MHTNWQLVDINIEGLLALGLKPMDFDQNSESFAARHAGLAQGDVYVNREGKNLVSIPYRGQPYFVSEFGGIHWNPNLTPGADSWGYGDGPRTLEEFHDRFAKLCRVLSDNPGMFGYCYVQLTDVFQEQNGIYQFNREPKFDLGRIWDAQSCPAAIEGDPGLLFAKHQSQI